MQACERHEKGDRADEQQRRRRATREEGPLTVLAIREGPQGEEEMVWQEGERVRQGCGGCFGCGRGRGGRGDEGGFLPRGVPQVHRLHCADDRSRFDYVFLRLL